METMTRVSATVDAQVRASLDTGDSSFECEGVRLLTDDPGKLIPFIDQLLFFLRLTRRKARPVTLRESNGVLEIGWHGRIPKAFRPGAHSLLCISEGECLKVIDLRRFANFTNHFRHLCETCTTSVIAIDTALLPFVQPE